MSDPKLVKVEIEIPEGTRPVMVLVAGGTVGHAQSFVCAGSWAPGSPEEGSPLPPPQALPPDLALAMFEAITAIRQEATAREVIAASAKN